ncbi:Ig-like domain-containing protein, partial [Sulfurospirillum oryzae]|uniref:Ig-like domain-containing protein n=1 Tax=Sulfurospirillum oryzae TaxID=2976535 RepID=UPI0021E7B5D3
MAQVIGYIKSLQNGIFFAKDAHGQIRELKAGDQVFKDELVYGAENNPQNAQVIIDVTLTDAKDIALSGAEQLYTDLSVIGGSFEKEDAVLSTDSLENAWKLSTNTANPDMPLDATAAGVEAPAAGQSPADGDHPNSGIFYDRTGAISDVRTVLAQDTVNGTISQNVTRVDTQDLNDRPVVENVTRTEIEALDGSNKISGQLVASDPDVGDTHTFFAVEGTLLLNGKPAPEGISFVLNPDGTYSVTGDFNHLAMGENAVVSFQYYAVDNGIDVGAPHNSLPATVTLTVQGTNDQPVISDINVNGGVQEEITHPSIAVFDNSKYVDSSNGYWAESDNIQATLTSQGHSVSAFTDESSAGFKTALANASVLIMPEEENGSYTNLSAGAKETIHDFVNDGGTLIINSAYVNYDTAFLNQMFGWSLSDSGIFYSDGGHPFSKTSDAIGTRYEGAPSSLPDNDGTYTIATSSLPEGALNLYADGNGHTAMFSITVGSGTVVFLAYDWYNAAPVGDYDGGWLDILNLAVSNTAHVIYETHDSSEGATHTNDGNNILTGALSVTDDDATDTHTFRVVDNSVQILDKSEAGITLDDVKVSITKGEDGTWQYKIDGDFTKLAAGEKATVTFQYVADDGHGFDGTDGVNESSVSAPKTITLTITGTNDQPVVENVVVSQNEVVDGVNTFTGTLVATDADAHDTHKFYGVTNEGEGGGDMPPMDDMPRKEILLKEMPADEKIVFIPKEVPQSIAYTLDAPTKGVYVDNITINENGTYSVVGDFNALATGEKAVVTFQYYAVDSSSTQANGESNTSEVKTVTLTIVGTNDAPVAHSDINSVTEAGSDDVGKFMATGNLLANDVDVDHNAHLDVASVNGVKPFFGQFIVFGEYGALHVNQATGQYEYVLNNLDSRVDGLDTKETLTETFTYVVTDEHGATSTSTLSITINGTNDAPTIFTSTGNWFNANDTVDESALANGTHQKGTTALAYGTFTIGDVDGLDDIKSISVAGKTFNVSSDNNFADLVGQTVATEHGEVTIASYSHGTFNYTYALTSATMDVKFVTETDSFKVIVSDGDKSDSATVTVNITDDAPIVTKDAQTTNEDVASISGNVLDNDKVGADGVGSVVFDHTKGTYGTLSYDSKTGAYTYTPNANAQTLAQGDSVQEKFTYTLTDGDGDKASSTLTITVTGNNDAPVFIQPSYSFNYNENSTAATELGTVQATDIDHGSRVTYSILSGNDAGYYTIDSATGAIKLTAAGVNSSANDFESPTNNHNLVIGASDSITTTSINVALNEKNVNEAPDAVNDMYVISGLRGQYYAYHEGDLLDGANLSNLAQVEQFIATHTADATFAAKAIDFKYIASGGLGGDGHLQTFLGTDASTLSNDPENSSDAIVKLSGSIELAKGDYTFRVTSDDGFSIVIDGKTVASDPTIHAPTTTDYTVNIAESGTHNISIVYWDQGGEAVLKVEVKNNVTDSSFHVLNGTSDALSNLVTNEDTPLTIAPSILLANDSDVDGDKLTITSVQGDAGTHGTVAIVNGNVVFTPEKDYNGDATFKYTVSDGNGATDTATVTLHVNPVNDAPAFGQASYTFGYNENSPTTAVLGTVHATDVDSTTLTYSIIGGNSDGYYAINSTTGAINLTDKGFASSANDFETGNNAHTLTVSVSDGSLSSSVTVTLNEQDVVEVIAHANADHIITNAGTSTFVVPEWALMANDTGATDITGVSNKSDLATVNLTSNSGSVTIQDNNSAPDWAWWSETNGGSFDYTANGSTAHVDVTQDIGRNLNGTNGNDILISNNGQPDIHGGKGDDILIGGNGNDYLYGEAGNDTLVYNPNNGIIDGGTGTDTLVFTQQNPNIDFGSLYSRNEPISGIEVLDLSKANVSLTNISYRDVLDITDSGKLTILGDASDNVDFANNEEWTKSATPVTEAINGASHTFDVYTNSHDSTVIVKVEQNIHDTI